MTSREYFLDLLHSDRIDLLVMKIRSYFSTKPINEPEEYALLLNQYEEWRGYKLSGTEQFKDITKFKRAFVRSTTRFLRRNVGDELWNESSSVEDSKLSLGDVTDKFLSVLQQFGVSALVSFTRYLIKRPELRQNLIRAEAEVAKHEFQHRDRLRKITYNPTGGSAHHEAARLQELSDVKKEGLLSKVAKMIGELTEEDLVEHYKLTFRNVETAFSWYNSAGERQLLISPLEMIQVPAYLNSHGDYLEYKRLMVQAQDAYLAHRYDEAHELFLRVRNEIDPESAQLYELLLVSYFKKHRGSHLIDSYLSTNTKRKAGKIEENPLYQIYIYASRFHLLQGNRKPDETATIRSADENYKKPGSDLIAQPAQSVFSPTGDKNLRVVTQELLLRIMQRHTSLTDRIVANVVTREKSTLELWRIITTTRDIYQYLQPDYFVFGSIVAELLGASAGFWITVDDDGQPANVYPEYDAVAALRAIINMVAGEKHRKQEAIQTTARKNLDQVREDVISNLAVMVSDGLRLKYEQLDDAPPLTPNEAAATYQPYVELVQSYRVADALLPGSGLFFDVPFMEIGNGRGKVDWFELGRGRNLYTRFTDPYFDALAYFEDLCHRKGAFTGVPTIGSAIEHLIQTYYHRLKDKTFNLYRSINLMGEFDLALAGRQRVGEILYCYRNWQICFDVNEDETFLKLCHDEVVGNGILFWWAIGKHGLHANPRNLPLGVVFDAREELNWLNDQCGVGTRENDFLTITENYVNRIVIPRSNEIGKRTHGQLNPAAEDQLDILHFAKKVTQLAIAVGPLGQLEDYVYDELVRENTFRWYDIQGERFINEERVHQHGIDAIPVLEEAMLAFSESNRFTTGHLQDMIALNRQEDILTSYKEDFSRNQEKNYDEDTIVLFVRMIERLIGYHKITGNAALLAMPYEELVTGKGKVRWARVPWTLLAIDKVLAVEKDENGKPARIGIKRWRVIGGRIHPRPRVRKISHFDFRDAYFYVKYNYETKAMVF